METPDFDARKPFLFLAAAVAFVSLLALVVWLFEISTAWLRFGVLTPSILALLFVSCFELKWQSRFFEQFLLSLKALLWMPLALAFFPALAGLAALLGNLGFENALDLGRAPGVNTILIITFLSLGEELGWRGYALPRLGGRFGWGWASLIIGVVWWLWHMPGWLIGFGAPSDISFWIFGLWVVSASFLFTYFYLKSGRSVWTAVLLHATANLSFGVFPVMPGAAGGPENFYLLCGLSVVAAALVMVLGGMREFGHKGGAEERAPNL